MARQSDDGEDSTSIEDQNEQLFLSLVESGTASTWDEIDRWMSVTQGAWIYRGQPKKSQLLTTSLERCTRLCNESSDNLGNQFSGYEYLPRLKYEPKLILEFQRLAAPHIKDPPADKELIAWLALMQHYGAPTRLLDWTTSLYVALFFALDGQETEDCSLWAIDREWIVTRSRELLKERSETIPDSDDPESMAAYISGFLARQERLNIVVLYESADNDARIAAQHGLFICDLGQEILLQSSLGSMMLHPQPIERPVIRRLDIDPKERVGLLKLLGDRNIFRGSLFPGFAGLDNSARLLKAKLEAGIVQKAETSGTLETGSYWIEK